MTLPDQTPTDVLADRAAQIFQVCLSALRLAESDLGDGYPGARDLVDAIEIIKSWRTDFDDHQEQAEREVLRMGGHTDTEVGNYLADACHHLTSADLGTRHAGMGALASAAFEVAESGHPLDARVLATRLRQIAREIDPT